MNSHKTEKNVRKSLCSLEKNIFKHKRISKGRNHVSKANWMIPVRESLLTSEELHQLWIKYYTDGHFRYERGEVMSKKSENKSKNADETYKNFKTANNNQSTRIVSTNTWNWAQVTEINQSNKSWDEINQVNVRNDTNDINDFAEILINQKWLPEKNTLNLSSTESSGCEFYNNINWISDSCLDVVEPPNTHKSANDQLNRDDYRENIDSNIFSDFEYIDHYNQFNQGLDDNYNISQEISFYQNNNQTMNDNYWCNDSRNNVVQPLTAECYDFDKLDYTIYDDYDVLNSSGDSILEYFSL